MCAGIRYGILISLLGNSFHMDQFFDAKSKSRFFGLFSTLIIVLIVFVAALAINTFKENGYIGHGAYTTPNTISVQGTGDMLAIPDTATFSFSVVTNAKTVTAAQDSAATKTNAIISAVKALGVADVDIQTTDYSSYPTYDSTRSICPLDQSVQPAGVVSSGSGSAQAMYIAYPPCTNSKQVLTGYEVSETITVKVRKTADAGAVLTKVGDLGATNISGLNFVIDNPDTVQAQARDKAIADAKAKAEVLAKSLGVRLTKIVNFSENGQYPGPIYYSMDAQTKSAGSAAAIPSIQTGQNKITSNVTITYEVD